MLGVGGVAIAAMIVVIAVRLLRFLPESLAGGCGSVPDAGKAAVKAA